MLLRPIHQMDFSYIHDDRLCSMLKLPEPGHQILLTLIKLFQQPVQIHHQPNPNINMSPKRKTNKENKKKKQRKIEKKKWIRKITFLYISHHITTPCESHPYDTKNIGIWNKFAI